MSASHRSLSPFVRDTIIAGVLYFVVLAPTVYDLGPDALGVVGYVLALPLLLAHAVLGGETENAFGPSTPLVVVYVLALAVVTAALAHLIRQHVDTAALGGLRFVGGAIPAIVGSLLGLAGIGALGGVLHVGTTVGLGALVAGIVLVTGGVLLVRDPAAG